MVFTPGMAAPRVKKLMLEGCVQEGIELRRASGYRQLPIAWETSFKLGLKLSYSDNGTKESPNKFSNVLKYA